MLKEFNKVMRPAKEGGSFWAMRDRVCGCWCTRSRQEVFGNRGSQGVWQKIPAYHKFTTRIPDTCCLEQVPWVQRLWILGKFKGLFSILGEDGEVLKRWKA